MILLEIKYHKNLLEGIWNQLNANTTVEKQQFANFEKKIISPRST